MEQVTYVVGNPTALLIERIFWLGLGGFLGVAILTSLIRGINESKNTVVYTTSTELKNLAMKATQQNQNID